MAQVTVTLAHASWTTNALTARWFPGTNNYMSLGDTLSADGATELFLGYVLLPRGINVSSANIRMAHTQAENVNTAGPEFSDAMETGGTITYEASNGDVLVLSMGDTTEPYSWTPTNIAEANAFANLLNTLTDRTVIITFDDGVADESEFSTVTVNLTGYEDNF